MVDKNGTKGSITFRLHPRVFAALGLDLVTNDTVAVIELVKNSYDASSTRVEVRFISDDGGPVTAIEVEDNGTGMTMEELSEIWAVVATPYKLNHPVALKGRKRRVSGEKGLGRLSTARLGEQLQLTTKANDSPCLQVDLNWSSLSQQRSIAECKFDVQTVANCPIERTGTLIKISDLRSEWDEERYSDLSDQLSRLVSPFQSVKDFSIWLRLPGKEAEASEVEPAAFLSSPPYLLKGTVNSKGYLAAAYRFSGGKHRTIKIKRSLQPPHKAGNKLESGPFEFEIRAWDFDAESLEKLSTSIDMGKEQIRKSIRNYKGLSVYRDRILVLPK